MEDIPWVPIAMVVIAFLSWLKNRMEEAAVYRRENRERKEAAQRSRNSTETPPPVYQSPYREEEIEFEEEVIEVPKTFRELMAEIEASNRDDQEVAPQQKSAPPPLPPTKTDPVVFPAKEVFENSFPTSLPEVSTIAPRPPVAKRISSTKAPGNETTHPLAKALKDRSQLRSALILKEILDKPRALQRR